jgi:hypothetical protein
MAAVHKWVHWNRSRIIGGFLLKRLFMLPRYSREYTLSSVLNPSLGLGVLNILIGRRINVGSISVFSTLGFFLDSFTLL